MGNKPGYLNPKLKRRDYTKRRRYKKGRHRKLKVVEYCINCKTRKVKHHHWYCNKCHKSSIKIWKKRNFI